MMVDTGGTRTCVHLHVSRPLYHCAMDLDNVWVNIFMSHLKAMIQFSFPVPSIALFVLNIKEAPLYLMEMNKPYEQKHH